MIGKYLWEYMKKKQHFPRKLLRNENTEKLECSVIENMEIYYFDIFMRTKGKKFFLLLQPNERESSQFVKGI